MKQKILLGVIALLVVGSGAWWLMNREQTPEPTTDEQPKKRKVVEPLNVIPTEERPAIAVVPEADGRNVSIVVSEVKKEATSVEYELEYQAGTLLQGAFGLIELATVPSETKILLGSCSAGGACTYHEDVQGGTLLTRYSGPENYALKSDWKYVDNSAREAAVSSRDAKFQLEADGLASTRYIVVFNSPGFPDTLPGKLVSDVYALNTSSTLQGTGTLTIRAAEEGQLQIVVWDGSAWNEVETVVDGKQATAELEAIGQFFAVIST